MADPLGMIGGLGARSVGVPAPSAATQAIGVGQSSFKDVLLDNLKQVNSMQQDATRAIEDLHTGKRSDLEGVVLATQKADTAFRMLQSVRNKVMEAYEEVKQIRV